MPPDGERHSFPLRVRAYGKVTKPQPVHLAEHKAASTKTGPDDPVLLTSRGAHETGTTFASVLVAIGRDPTYLMAQGTPIQPSRYASIRTWCVAAPVSASACTRR